MGEMISTRIGRLFLPALGLIFVSLFFIRAAGSGPSPVLQEKKPRDVPGLLREIHREVSEMKPYPGEGFVRGDFSISDDDDDTYRRHHVGILLQDLEGRQVMTIRITRLEPTSRDPRIRLGREARAIVCRIGPDEVEITHSDYPPEELNTLLADVLQAVLKKKNLLKKLPERLRPQR